VPAAPSWSDEAKPDRHLAAHVGGDIVRGTRCIDDGDALGRCGGAVEEAAADALVERLLAGVEASRGAFGMAAGEAGLDRKVEEEREIGERSVEHGLV
jgi:hypothetical protein